MNKWVLSKWKELIFLIEKEDNISRKKLIEILINWINEIKKSKENSIIELYKEYFFSFEELTITNYWGYTELWFNLKELIEYDLLKFKPKKTSSIFGKIHYVLEELFTFKSNKECPSCNDNDLRVFSDKNKDSIYFSCDTCGYTEDFEQNKYEAKELLIPASYFLVKKNKLKPSK